MKKKLSNRVLSVFMAAALSGTSAMPAVAAEFTAPEAVEAAETFEAESADASEEALFDAEETGAAFSDGEQPEDIVYNDGMEYQYAAETDSYILTKGKERELVDIPAEINGKPVTEIGIGAFANLQNLRRVRIYGPVKTAGGAFANCPRLYEFWAYFNTYEFERKCEFAADAFDSDSKVIVTFYGEMESKELKDAGIWMFNIEENNLWGVPEDGMYTINGHVVDCDDSSSIVRIDRQEVIRRRAFSDCENLREVEIKSDALRSIETKAFANCSNLEKILIPEGVTDISGDAFEGAEQAVIYTPEGSYAEEFAKERNMTVVPVDEDGLVSEEFLGRAEITSASVVAAEKRLAVSLTEEAANADGYDFVLGTNNKCIETGEFVQTKRNRTEPTASFNMAKLRPVRDYYVACRPWREVDGVKVYGEWSRVCRKYISEKAYARTKAPVIKKAKVSGNKVTVSLSATSYPDGFYCILGSTKDDTRPWKVKYVKRDQKSKTITFTNVKKGTYYIGARSYKEMQDGTQNYGGWSGMKKITVK